MKKTKIIFKFFILFILFYSILNSCKKGKSSLENEPNFQATNDNSLSENIFNNISGQMQCALSVMNDSIPKNKGGRQGMNQNMGQPDPDPGQGGDKFFDPHAKVSLFPFDTLSWPKELTIDYGDTNSLGNDNIYRKGKIRTIISNRFQNEGSEITILLDNYYFNNNKIEGVKIIKNKGRNAKHHLIFSESVVNAKITKSDGTIIQWSEEIEKEWINGEQSNNDVYDDEYLITGTRTGIDSKGQAYSVSIDKALDILVGCQWTRSGIVNFSSGNDPSKKITFSVDYGKGSCDADATLTYNSQNFPFQMK